MKDNFENLLSTIKIAEILEDKKKDDTEKKVLWALAIIGAVAAIAGIAYAVYRFLTPDYLEDFDEDFEDDFDEDFYDDLEKEEEAKDAEEEAAKETNEE